MKLKSYSVPTTVRAGITLADHAEAENNNMALHICECPEQVMENRRKLAAFLNCSTKDFVCSTQTHSANFHKVTRAERGRGSSAAADAIPDTDALYTFEKGLVLCCFTADCVPVILYDEVSGLIGTIHSGWEGTVKEITPAVLAHVIREEHCRPRNLRIVIGPALSSEKFEVDRDVRDRFSALGYADEFISRNEQTNKYHIDNQLTVKRQCELQGIPAENIIVDRTCTYLSPDGFSYRREKNCGRHMSFIVKKG